MIFFDWLFGGDDDKSGQWSHYGCDGNVDEVYSAPGLLVGKCDRCGKRCELKGDGMIVHQRGE